MPIRSFRVIPEDVAEWDRFFRETPVTPSDDTVDEDIIRDGAVTEPKLADDAVATRAIQDNAVDDVRLRDSAGCSVIGRAQSSTGNPADIVVATSGNFLVRRGTSLVGDTIQDTDIPSNIARDTEVATAISDHEAALNPHPGYLTEAEGDARYSQFEADTYTVTLTGCTTSPTATVRLVRSGQLVLAYIPTLSATSNATTCTLTGTMPANFRPARQQDVIGRAEDNGLNGVCGYRIQTGGTIEMFFGAGLAAFTAAGNKGTSNCTLAWSLD